MQKNYTAVIKRDGDWWIGWIEEVPGVNCQGTTHEELIDSLGVTCREMQEFDRAETPAFRRRGDR